MTSHDWREKNKTKHPINGTLAKNVDPDEMPDATIVWHLISLYCLL